MIDLVWMTRHVARVETLAVVVVDVHASATAADLDRVVAEIRAAKGWPSETERIVAYLDKQAKRYDADGNIAAWSALAIASHRVARGDV